MFSGSYLDDLENVMERFISEFFFSFPDSQKPPMTSRLVYDLDEDCSIPGPDDEIKAFEIQMAVAGFEKKDIDVEFSDKTIAVSGSNLKNKFVATKFAHSFRKKFVVNNKMDLDNTVAKLQDGILSIVIPVIEPKETLWTIEVE